VFFLKAARTPTPTPTPIPIPTPTPIPISTVSKAFYYQCFLSHFLLRDCYKPAGRGFDSPYGVIGIFIDIILPTAIRLDSVSIISDYQVKFPGGKGGRCVGLTTLTL